MVLTRCKRDENGTVVSNSERILRGGRQFAAVSNAPTPFRDLLIAPQLLEAALEKVSTLMPKVEAEDTIESLVGRLVSEIRPASRIRPAHIPLHRTS